MFNPWIRGTTIFYKQLARKLSRMVDFIGVPYPIVDQITQAGRNAPNLKQALNVAGPQGNEQVPQVPV